VVEGRLEGVRVQVLTQAAAVPADDHPAGTPDRPRRATCAGVLQARGNGSDG
jgi:hypothetical protein